MSYRITYLYFVLSFCVNPLHAMQQHPRPNSPLLAAACDGDFATVSLLAHELVSKGVPLNTVNNYGISALGYVMMTKPQKPAHYPANLSDTYKSEFFKNRLQTVKDLVLSKADTRIVHRKYRKSALHYAAEQGDEGCMNFLINRGTPIDGQDAFGNAPLHYAIGRGHILAASLLIREGAHKDLLNRAGKTPLHIAVEENNYNAVLYLLDQDVDLYKRSLFGNTAPELAKKLNRHALTELFKNSDSLRQNSGTNCSIQ